MITASECGHSCMTHECFSFDLFTYATLIIRPTTRSTFLWVHRNLLWQLSRDRYLHGSSMSNATTASPKSSFRAPWRVGDAVVGTGNAGWTMSSSGHPCPYQNCSQGPPADKAARGCLQNRLSCLPDDPIGQGPQLK